MPRADPKRGPRTKPLGGQLAGARQRRSHLEELLRELGQRESELEHYESDARHSLQDVEQSLQDQKWEEQQRRDQHDMHMEVRAKGRTP